MSRVLYKTILGDRFEQVPAQIKEMHTYARHAVGTARVTRGHSLPAAIVCRLAALPPEQEKVQIETSFADIEGGERWTRRFDGKPFETDMIAGTNEPYPCMIERLGPFVFKMRVTANPSGVDLTPEQVSLWGLKLPTLLAPRAVGRERVVDGRYCFSVEVSFPLIGKIFGYEGTIEPCEFVADHEPA